MPSLVSTGPSPGQCDRMAHPSHQQDRPVWQREGDQTYALLPNGPHHSYRNGR